MQFITGGKRRNEIPDEELIREFTLSKDLEILGELYSRYMHLVYGVCLKYLKNRDDSMDAVIQIFEKLIVEIPEHKPENFRSWLYVVTKNFCFMKLRSGKTLQKRELEWQNDPLVIMESDEEMHPLDEEPGGNTEQALADCIERLKEQQKKCIEMFYYGNKCYAEIALSLGTDEKAVKSHLQNAKRNLKICLEEKNGSKG
ncbi:MAG: sigma-70 family RNA polymerase sigma factor [Bacteroidales bacterium]|nr:sigma-70 family RNA polymerase sigma factor [Bacteroidales bacterium]